MDISFILPAINISGGVSAGLIDITGIQQDFIINIDETSGICNLLYLANGKKGEQKGQDVHVITYTLTDV